MKVLMRLVAHVSCFVIVVLFFALLLWRVRTLDSTIGVFLPGSVELPGAVGMILGGALMALCAAVFIVVGEGTPSPVDPTKRLVAVGPYKYVRNPIYIGQVTFFAGLGLYLRSVAILLFSLAWFFFCYLYVVLIEERGLKKRFAGSYEEYWKTVPRWIPRIDLFTRSTKA